MNAYRVRPLSFPWTPFVYIAAILIAVGLDRIFPLELMEGWHLTFFVAGTLSLAISVWLGFWGFRKLYQCGTAMLSSSPATRLVTSGPFRFTRNPVYLAYTLATLGAGMVTGNAWLIAAAIVTAGITHAWIIRREEKHLLARFGFEFENYCRRTRAWI
jgi:protein-S-isoprenylcysteine O-methyltransferase Ste14